MKSSIPYEILAILLAFAGVAVLGYALFPLLNPIQYRLHTGQSEASIRHLVAVPVALLILWAAWRINCKAILLKRLKKEAECRQLANAERRASDS